MGEVARENRRKSTFIRRWGAVFILLALFIGSWGGQFITQLEAARHQSQEHGQEFAISEFWPEFWSSTFENWQSEWLQLFVQAFLISGLASYLFRTENEEHYKTQMMIEDLKEQISRNQKSATRHK